MAHYKRKAWDVDAWRMPLRDAELPGFNGEAGIVFKREDGFATEATITTVEDGSSGVRKRGTKLVRSGDWIIRRGPGDLRSMSNDEFRENYEFVDDKQDLRLRKDLGLRPDLRVEGELVGSRFIRTESLPEGEVMDVREPVRARQ